MTVFVIIAFSVFFSLPCFFSDFFRGKTENVSKTKGRGTLRKPLPHFLKFHILLTLRRFGAMSA